MTTRSDSLAVPAGAVRKARGLARKVLNFLADPDRFFRRQGLPLRRAWWRAAHLWLYRDIAKRRRLASQLPGPSVLTPIDPSIGSGFTSGAAAKALTAEAVGAARDYVDSIDLEQAVAENPGLKSYLIPLAKQHPIPVENPVFELARHPEIVGTVAKYLGYLPILTYVNVWYSPVWQADKPFMGSQRFHLDNEDIKQVKVFIYLHDVDDDHSPTMYVGKDRSLELCRLHYDDMRKDNVRIDERFLGDETIVHHNGPAGSVCMLDTSGCLHAGGRCRKERKLLVFQYLTPCSHVRNRGTHQQFEFLRKAEMSELDRAVLNLD